METTLQRMPSRRRRAHRGPVLARRRLGPWRESVTLANGREVVIRPLERADAPMLVEGFKVLSPEEVRMRFQHPITELTPQIAEELATVDAKRNIALAVAEPLPPGDALIGAVARAMLDDDDRNATFALIVAKPIAGYGIGSHLLRKLVEWAQRKRLDSIHGDVLIENATMLGIAERLGFTREHVPGEHGIVRVVRKLR
jgi:RimJ/RimL family protein N-acetyltransferase